MSIEMMAAGPGKSVVGETMYGWMIYLMESERDEGWMEC